MIARFLQFVRAISISPLGRLGTVLVTSSFVTFLAMEILRVLGIITNAYVGLITYLVFPTLFVVGLVIIPIAWARVRRSTGLTSRQLMEKRFGESDLRVGFLGAPVIANLAILTALNVAFLGGAANRSLHFMETPEFCGTACHSAMNPEWTTYQDSPHAKVHCVDCHVGEGFGAMVNAKMNGAHQLLAITLGNFERPIPTPVRNLRPARDTCEHCHWPQKAYGDRLVTRVTYAEDSLSTASYTTLSLKIDAGHHAEQRGIHWHVAEDTEVRYASIDEREKILWVESRRPDGTWRRWENHRITNENPVPDEVRTMDCVDCHNRATHVYESPAKAIDRRIEAGLVDRSLPWMKREALAAVAGSYRDEDLALRSIANRMRNFYARNYPKLAQERSDAIERSIVALQGAWSRNVHPDMHIEWGTYPSHLGHRESAGCFRCHNRDLVDADGGHISDSCTLCHSILADESVNAFHFLRDPDRNDIDAQRHRYLRDDFLKSYAEGSFDLSRND